MLHLWVLLAQGRLEVVDLRIVDVPDALLVVDVRLEKGNDVGLGGGLEDERAALEIERVGVGRVRGGVAQNGAYLLAVSVYVCVDIGDLPPNFMAPVFLVASRLAKWTLSISICQGWWLTTKHTGGLRDAWPGCWACRG